MEETSPHEVPGKKENGPHQVEGQFPPQEVVAESCAEDSSGGSHGKPQTGAIRGPGNHQVDMHQVREVRWKTVRFRKGMQRSSFQANLQMLEESP